MSVPQCPVCELYSPESNCVKIDTPNRAAVPVCWSCAQLLAVAVKGAYEAEALKDRAAFVAAIRIKKGSKKL